MTVMKSPKDINLAFIGMGKFGTAVGFSEAEDLKNVTFWARDEEKVRQVNEDRYMPALDLNIPSGLKIRATNDIEEAVAGADVIAFAVKSGAIPSVAQRFVPPGGSTIVSLAKGAVFPSDDPKNVRTPLQTLHDAWGDNYEFAVMTGPGFAYEIASGIPVFLHLSARTMQQAKHIAGLLETENINFRLGNDVTNAEMGGILKNVYSIMLGILDGLAKSDAANLEEFKALKTPSIKTNFFSRSLVEAARIVQRMEELCRVPERRDGEPPRVQVGSREAAFGEFDDRTMFGQACLADLYLSTSPGGVGRNYELGLALSEGRKAEDFMRETRDTYEGYRSAIGIKVLSDQHDIDTPILDCLIDIFQGMNPIEAVITTNSRRGSKREFPVKKDGSTFRALLAGVDGIPNGDC